MCNILLCSNAVLTSLGIDDAFVNLSSRTVLHYLILSICTSRQKTPTHPFSRHLHASCSCELQEKVPARKYS